jgi:dolichyl-phosphate-mannose--protein O-mannosyl transferase
LSTRSAIVAAGFLALDPLHFVQSRIAMLDIFTTAFGVATIVCVRASIVTERRSWLIAAGVMGGVTAATKVPGALFVVLAIVLYMLWDRGSARWVRTRRAVVYLGLIPLVAFTALHIGVVDGHVFALPWSEGSWWRAFFERQADAVSYHLALDQVHSYQSPAWSWPLLRTPIAYMSAVRGSEGIGEVLAVGNPALWWPALIALLWLAFHPKGGGKAHPAAQAAVVGFAVTYLPWLFLGWARPAYLFYFVPTLPFMYLALATAVERLAHLAVTKHAIAVLVTAAVVFFGLYFPVMTASEIPRDRWRALMLFEDCDRLQGVDPDSPDYRPLTEVGIEPSSGWCWI